MSIIEVEGLWVRYGSQNAVRDVSFSVPEGAICGFIGPNGAGKSSTLRVLATLQAPTLGRIRVSGFDVSRQPQSVRGAIGYVADEFGVYENISVHEYMYFFAAAYKVPALQREALIEQLLELTDLQEKADSLVDSLSRGMKQRLALARVLVHEPKVLLLDEPASGLDPRARIEMRELLKALQGMGKTILISSHILHELSELCSEVVIIEQGRVVARGNLNDICRELELQRVVHVQVADTAEEHFRKFRSILGVSRMERSTDRLSFHIDEGTLQPEELLLALQQCGARVRMFQPEALDMETVFMKLTDGKTA